MQLAPSLLTVWIASKVSANLGQITKILDWIKSNWFNRYSDQYLSVKALFWDWQNHKIIHFPEWFNLLLTSIRHKAFSPKVYNQLHHRRHRQISSHIICSEPPCSFSIYWDFPIGGVLGFWGLLQLHNNSSSSHLLPSIDHFHDLIV